MTTDALAELGQVFLGSRLKRLADRFQSDATEALHAAGLPIQPAHMLILAVLGRRGPQTVGALAGQLRISQPTVSRTVVGLIDQNLVVMSRNQKDQRHRTLDLSIEGRALVARAEREFWPRVDAAVGGMCAGLSGPLLAQIATLEAEMEKLSLSERIALVNEAADPVPEIRDYSDELAPDFYRINAEWIEDMFVLEENDKTALSHPRELIIDQGGAILFAETKDLGVVGTCALMNMGQGWFELTKMAVLKAARGRKVGELLLQSALRRARDMDIAKLYLLTNTKCAAAIHLYEKHGFQHDPEIMAKFGSRYERCNVAMRYRGPGEHPER